jgi:DNA-binding MarR family transcriptional regulator
MIAMSRLENLVGAFSLTVADRLVDETNNHGLSASDHASLVTLRAYPDRPVSWLGTVLGLSSSGATRLVDRLVGAGLVTRVAASDSRERRLRLTAAGRRRAATAVRERHQTLSSSLEVLTTAERDELERLLDRLVSSLATTRQPALQTCRLCDREACASGGRGCPLQHTVPEDDRDA